MSRQRRPLRLWHFVLCAGLGLGLLGLALWPGLPAVHQDEYMPLLPLTWFLKEPAARSAVLAAYSRSLLGEVVPLLAYPYLGAVKAYAYAATGLPTAIGALRMAKLALVWGLFVVILRGCWSLSRASRLACGACLFLLLSDVSLVALGVLDAGNQILSLTLGACLFVLLYSVVDAPRWWKALPIAVVTFVGAWDRVNFLWFVGAGLAACVAGALAGQLRKSVRGLAFGLAGCALGLGGVALLLPSYPQMAWAGAQRSIGTLDLPALWQHWLLLFTRLDPFAAYHVYVDTASPSFGDFYAFYRWAWILLYLATIVLCAAWGLAGRASRAEAARPLLFQSAFMAALLFLVLKTSESWASHHVLVLRPFAWVGLALLLAAGREARLLWRAVATAALVLAVGHAGISLLGYREMTEAPPILGEYDVSWNQVQAWQAAAAAPVTAVYALDWGVFYPGVVNSPANQRWEMPRIDGPEDLRRLGAVRKGLDVGLLFRTRGPRGWLLEAQDAEERYGIKGLRFFDRHAGEAWALAVVNFPRRTTLPSAGDVAAEIVRNGSFADGSLGWAHEKWAQPPQAAQLAITSCEIAGVRRACARLDHRVPADSRIVQPIVLAPGVVYELSAWARSEGVEERGKGVHLVLLDHYEAESQELHGSSEWERLRFYVVNLGDEARGVRLGARLGTWGSLTGGRAWFAEVSGRGVLEPERGVPLYEIGGPD